MIEHIRSLRRKIKHYFGSYPIYQVVDHLKKNNCIQNTRILEAFANTGEHQAPAYYPYASYFEAWEINPDCEALLKKNLPKATIKITNTYKEVHICNKKFNLIVLDAHMGIFGPQEEYCEHFEILPEIFRLCEDQCTLIFNVMPYCEEKWSQKYPTVFREKHLERRKDFYNCPDPTQVPYEYMSSFYSKLCKDKGFNVDWVFYHQRHLLHYCVIKIKKQ